MQPAIGRQSPWFGTAGRAMRALAVRPDSRGGRWRLTAGPLCPPPLQVLYDVVGSSYANALVEVAQAQNALEAVHTDMDALASVLKESEDMKSLLSDPTMNETAKKDLLKRIASECGFSQYTTNFLQLLVDSNRFDAIEEIATAFEVRYCELTDTQVAVLRSAVKLEQEQQFMVAKKLQELTNSKNIKVREKRRGTKQWRPHNLTAKSQVMHSAGIVLLTHGCSPPCPAADQAGH